MHNNGKLQKLMANNARYILYLCIREAFAAKPKQFPAIANFKKGKRKLRTKKLQQSNETQKQYRIILNLQYQNEKKLFHLNFFEFDFIFPPKRKTKENYS